MKVNYLVMSVVCLKWQSYFPLCPHEAIHFVSVYSFLLFLLGFNPAHCSRDSDMRLHCTSTPQKEANDTKGVLNHLCILEFAQKGTLI